MFIEEYSLFVSFHFNTLSPIFRSSTEDQYSSHQSSSLRPFQLVTKHFYCPFKNITILFCSFEDSKAMILPCSQDHKESAHLFNYNLNNSNNNNRQSNLLCSHLATTSSLLIKALTQLILRKIPSTMVLQLIDSIDRITNHHLRLSKSMRLIPQDIFKMIQLNFQTLLNITST